MKIIPYLTFDGRCKEAFELYKDVLGGELFCMSFADAPEDVGMPKDKNLIMHACLTVGDFSLMASDCRQASRSASRKVCRFPLTSTVRRRPSGCSTA